MDGVRSKTFGLASKMGAGLSMLWRNWDSVFEEEDNDRKPSSSTTQASVLDNDGNADEDYSLDLTYGTYTFANGVTYRGFFYDGDFHGKGTLVYPCGQKIVGVWKSGELISWTYKFSDGLEWQGLNWDYCKEDRRYVSNIKYGLDAPSKERVTHKSTNYIPPHTFDVGDGYFNLKTVAIHNYYKGTINRTIQHKEDKIIISNYRTGNDKNVGYDPELYPKWISGRKCPRFSSVPMM